MPNMLKYFSNFKLQALYQNIFSKFPLMANKEKGEKYKIKQHGSQKLTSQKYKEKILRFQNKI